MLILNRPTLRPFLAALAMLCALAASTADAKAPPQKITGVISWPTVSEKGRKLSPDADTPRVRVKVCDGKTCHYELQKLRLRYADAPEIGQAGGQEALAYAKSAWQGREVVASKKGDSYGRPVVDIVDKDGNDLATDLVSHGWAMVDPRYNPSSDLLAAQKKAAVAGVGVWKDPKAETPWDYRSRQKSKLIELRRK